MMRLLLLLRKHHHPTMAHTTPRRKPVTTSVTSTCYGRSYPARTPRNCTWWDIPSGERRNCSPHKPGQSKTLTVTLTLLYQQSGKWPWPWLLMVLLHHRTCCLPQVVRGCLPRHGDCQRYVYRGPCLSRCTMRGILRCPTRCWRMDSVVMAAAMARTMAMATTAPPRKPPSKSCRSSRKDGRPEIPNVNKHWSFYGTAVLRTHTSDRVTPQRPSINQSVIRKPTHRVSWPAHWATEAKENLVIARFGQWCGRLRNSPTRCGVPNKVATAMITTTIIIMMMMMMITY